MQGGRVNGYSKLRRQFLACFLDEETVTVILDSSSSLQRSRMVVDFLKECSRDCDTNALFRRRCTITPHPTQPCVTVLQNEKSGQRLIVVQFERRLVVIIKWDKCIRWRTVGDEAVRKSSILRRWIAGIGGIAWICRICLRVFFFFFLFLLVSRSRGSLRGAETTEDEEKMIKNWKGGTASWYTATVQKNVQIENVKKGSGEWSVSFEIKRICVRSYCRECHI